MSKHITGHTGLLCLLGSPVAHSVSPEMHNEACDQLGLDYTYLAFDVPEEKMPQAVEGLRTMGARGWNITMPGKNIMCKLADKVSPASEISGACNTIVNDNGVLTAYTTDGVGFMKAVAENGVDIIGKKMTLLGAGGAATAILVQAALDGVAEINVFNVRDAFFPRAEEIVAKLNERTGCKVTLHDYSDPEVLRASIKESAILVNGTSVGMAPNTDRTIITDTSMFHKDLFVFDVIYNPQETRLLREAKEAGCTHRQWYVHAALSGSCFLRALDRGRYAGRGHQGEYFQGNKNGIDISKRKTGMASEKGKTPADASFM